MSITRIVLVILFIPVFYLSVSCNILSDPAVPSEPPQTTVAEPLPTVPWRPPTNTSISGQVYDSVDGTPIPGATVYIREKNRGHLDMPNEVRTDSMGNYIVLNIMGGEYTINVFAQGYRPELYNGFDGITEPRTNATIVVVTDNTATTGINISMKRSATISGRVYRTDNGEPIAGAQICVYGPHWVTCSPVGATTDANGRYVVTDLNLGESSVTAEAEGYATKLYNGVYLKDEAITVITALGNDTPNIDFALDWGGSIQGHVYQGNGKTPVPEAQVWFMERDKASLPRCMPYEGGPQVKTASDGSYNITGLGSGHYDLSATKDNLYSAGITLVHVIIGQEYEPIDFNLQASGSISGYVYESDNITPISNANVVAQSPLFTYRAGNPPFSEARTDSNGYYVLNDLPPGEYHVQATAENHPTTYYGNVPFWLGWGSDSKVNVVSGRDTGGIDFSLSTYNPFEHEP